MSLLIAATLMFTGATDKPTCSATCVRRVHARQRAHRQARHARQCRQSKPLPCIRFAANRWHVSYPTLVRKARCESGLRWNAFNPSGASGLFQFIPSTFASTPYRNRWIFSARYSALAAAWMHAQRRGNEWSCR